MTEREIAENVVIRAQKQPEDRIRIEQISEQWVKQRLVSLAEKLGLKPVIVAKGIIEIRGKNNHSNKLRITHARTQERQNALEELRETLRQRGIIIEQKPLSLKKRLEAKVRRVRRRKPI